MIYIATHKKFNPPHLEGYIPLHVGAENKEHLGYIEDNTYDNISLKNPSFCELTGLYWIWKNCSDEYIGLVHYRRYFGKSSLSNSIEHIYTYAQMIGFLETADIVLPYIEHFKENAKSEILQECCTKVNFDRLRNTIEELNPEYLADFDQFFRSNRATLFNMLFCHRKVFDSYCSWLFNILFHFESVANLERLSNYQKRLFGFVSERLLNVWVAHNQLRIKHVSVINTTLSLGERLKLIRRRITNECRFVLSSLFYLK